MWLKTPLLVATNVTRISGVLRVFEGEEWTTFKRAPAICGGTPASVTSLHCGTPTMVASRGALPRRVSKMCTFTNLGDDYHNRNDWKHFPALPPGAGIAHKRK